MSWTPLCSKSDRSSKLSRSGDLVATGGIRSNAGAGSNCGTSNFLRLSAEAHSLCLARWCCAEQD